MSNLRLSHTETWDDAMGVFRYLVGYGVNATLRMSQFDGDPEIAWSDKKTTVVLRSGKEGSNWAWVIVDPAKGLLGAYPNGTHPRTLASEFDRLSEVASAPLDTDES